MCSFLVQLAKVFLECRKIPAVFQVVDLIGVSESYSPCECTDTALHFVKLPTFTHDLLFEPLHLQLQGFSLLFPLHGVIDLSHMVLNDGPIGLLKQFFSFA